MGQGAAEMTSQRAGLRTPAAKAVQWPAAPMPGKEQLLEPELAQGLEL